jgi:hypothetical protein
MEFASTVDGGSLIAAHRHMQSFKKRCEADEQEQALAMMK